MRKSGQTLTVTPSWRLKSGSWARQETLFTLPSSLQFHHQHQQKEPSAVAHGIRDQRVISPLPEGTIRKKDPCFSGLEGSSCKKHKSYGGGDTPQLLPQEVRGRMTLIANAFSILALCKTKMAAQQRRVQEQR
ncbi:uncharacterized protein LOC144303948 isoform X3 [Canis aureus]